MPINFSTLVTSEYELRKLLLNYYEHVIKMQESLLAMCKPNHKISKDDWEKMVEMERQCNISEATILDETSWIISKDMPRAAHLRYLIAVIRSIKDLERMGDFAFNVGKYFHNYKVDKNICKILKNIASKSIAVVKTFYKNLQIVRGQSRKYYSTTATNLITEFGIEYKVQFKELGKLIFESNKRLDANAIGAFTAAKNMERNADHAFNIIENFTYISEGNFFFTKESRKGY